MEGRTRKEGEEGQQDRQPEEEEDNDDGAEEDRGRGRRDTQLSANTTAGCNAMMREVVNWF